MSEMFVVGMSWRTAKVDVREKLAFREEELEPTLRALTAELPVAEALLISTCNRVEVYGVARPGHDVTNQVRAFLAKKKQVAIDKVGDAIYGYRSNDAIRHVFRVASALDSLVVGEAQILGQLKDAYQLSNTAGTSGSLLNRCMERAFGAAKRVRSETGIARGAANVSSVAVELAQRVFGDLSDKSVLVVGAGKMSRLAARHLYNSGATHIVVTNRSPAKAEALAAEIDGIAKPFADLDKLLTEADIVISSTGAVPPLLDKARFKKVAKARKWRPITVIDIAVPRDAEPAISELDGVYLFDIDDLERVVHANLSERAKAAEQAHKIVDHEAAQFEQWLRTQGVVPTIRALRDRFAQVAEAEVQKTLETLARKEHTPAQQREAITRLVQLVVNKLLHQPTTSLREAPPGEAEIRAAVLCELFDLQPVEGARDSQSNIELPTEATAEAKAEKERLTS